MIPWVRIRFKYDPFILIPDDVIFCGHLSRLGCNYFVVSHETGKGLIATRGQGRPSKQGNNAAHEDEIVLPNFS